MKIMGAPHSRCVWVDGVFLSPSVSQRLWNHSPDGFNWGYEGSGPAQLALAILLHAGLDAPRAVRLHQRFKREHLASLPQGHTFFLDLDVIAWAATCEDP
jgi:Family of unknown function (DUF6166)